MEDIQLLGVTISGLNKTDMMNAKTLKEGRDILSVSDFSDLATGLVKTVGKLKTLLRDGDYKIESINLKKMRTCKLCGK